MWVVILAVIVGIGYWIWRESQKAKVAEEKRSESGDAPIIRLDVGGFTQSLKQNRGNDAKWLTPGNEVVVAGHSLSSGFVYVCDYPSSAGSRWSDPSLINRSLPVNARASRTQEIGYWPSYSGLSPGSRAGYLAWLAAGRSGENVEPGYLFVFFYGLERRVLDELMPRTLDEMTSKCAWNEEMDAIAGEVARLMSLNPNCRSFQMYAGSFVDFLACYKARTLGEQIAPATATAKQWDIPSKVKVALGQLVKAGEPIPARWALSWAYSAPSISLRTPARRCREQFEELFTRLYTDRYGEGIVIPPNKTPLTVKYRAASTGVFRRQEQLFMKLPDVTILKRPVDKLNRIVEECTGLLDKYSRALGRKSTDTPRGYLPALLPRELLEQATIGGVARLRAWLQESVAPPETITTTTAREILSRFRNEPPEKFSRRLWELTVLLVGKLGYGVEPNPQYGGKYPSLSGTVCLFREDWEPERHLSSEFKAVSALLPFAVMVCASDGAAEAELELISGQLSRLEPNERRRLEARTKVLLDSPPAVRSLGGAVSGLGEQQKRSIARFLLLITAADGRITQAEIETLEKAYRVLDLPLESVHSDIHKLMTGVSGATGKKPVAVRKAGRQASSYKLPPEPKLERGVLVLDSESVRRKRQESESVVALLEEVFAEHDLDGPVEVSSPDEQQIESILDESQMRLLLELLHSEEIPEARWTEMCREVGLLPRAAIEAINEAVLDVFDDVLIVSSDPIGVEPETAKLLRGVV